MMDFRAYLPQYFLALLLFVLSSSVFAIDPPFFRRDISDREQVTPTDHSSHLNEKWNAVRREFTRLAAFLTEAYLNADQRVYFFIDDGDFVYDAMKVFLHPDAHERFTLLNLHKGNLGSASNHVTAKEVKSYLFDTGLHATEDDQGFVFVESFRAQISRAAQIRTFLDPKISGESKTLEIFGTNAPRFYQLAHALHPDGVETKIEGEIPDYTELWSSYDALPMSAYPGAFVGETPWKAEFFANKDEAFETKKKYARDPALYFQEDLAAYAQSDEGRAFFRAERKKYNSWLVAADKENSAFFRKDLEARLKQDKTGTILQLADFISFLKHSPKHREYAPRLQKIADSVLHTDSSEATGNKTEAASQENATAYSLKKALKEHPQLKFFRGKKQAVKDALRLCIRSKLESDEKLLQLAVSQIIEMDFWLNLTEVLFEEIFDAHRMRWLSLFETRFKEEIAPLMEKQDQLSGQPNLRVYYIERNFKKIFLKQDPYLQKFMLDRIWRASSDEDELRNALSEYIHGILHPEAYSTALSSMFFENLADQLPHPQATTIFEMFSKFIDRLFLKKGKVDEVDPYHHVKTNPGYRQYLAESRKQLVRFLETNKETVLKDMGFLRRFFSNSNEWLSPNPFVLTMLKIWLDKNPAIVASILFTDKGIRLRDYLKQAFANESSPRAVVSEIFELISASATNEEFTKFQEVVFNSKKPPTHLQPTLDKRCETRSEKK